MPTIHVSFEQARLKRQIRLHLRAAGFSKDSAGMLQPPSLDKETYRNLHRPQRLERIEAEHAFVVRAWPRLCQYFAEGLQIDVDRIKVRLELIEGESWQADLFRLACLTWSVPVSRGFGRRLRFLVWDDFNDKLIGLFALGDPVFNLKARDDLIGWSGDDRGERLVYVLDAYVMGAVPPYNRILGGKLVASLIRTEEVVRAFKIRYAKSKGIISRKTKKPSLVAVTTTSALGRSSLYNRLRLDEQWYFSRIGFTTGFGHFHFPERLFEQMRTYLKSKKDPYAANHGYGEGPNWRMRTIQRALILVGLKAKLVRHGLKREVFISQLADNAVAVLRGHSKRPRYDTLKSVEEVAQLALTRWIQPRARRDPTYRVITLRDVWRLIADNENQPEAVKVERHAVRD